MNCATVCSFRQQIGIFARTRIVPKFLNHFQLASMILLRKHDSTTVLSNAFQAFQN
ncbi:hypothetical protein Bhyg_04677 [Pseudolycoriella hygida]|uniref:Uncharacterized protein n=1 Tax=Pseudolycoriella hygida TaxID=35572 RepID=A0A9Q0NFP5_9DIPT|nr:hypothetical protein Bhyg_04677 [Pseudolycoriella hygida]